MATNDSHRLDKSYLLEHAQNQWRVCSLQWQWPCSRGSTMQCKLWLTDWFKNNNELLLVMQGDLLISQSAVDCSRVDTLEHSHCIYLSGNMWDVTKGKGMHWRIPPTTGQYCTILVNQVYELCIYSLILFINRISDISGVGAQDAECAQKVCARGFPVCRSTCNKYTRFSRRVENFKWGSHVHDTRAYWQHAYGRLPKDASCLKVLFIILNN